MLIFKKAIKPVPKRSGRAATGAFMVPALCLSLCVFTSCATRPLAAEYIRSEPYVPTIMTESVAYPERSVLPDSELSAASAVLIEAQTMSVLKAKEANVPRPMASTTKIATAITAIELWEQRGLSLCDVVTVDAAAVGIEGSSVYLSAGERITMEDLLYAVMLESANDAAAAVALAVSGSEAEFSDEMNSLARRVGLEQTHFVNPHGLDDENHYTTAYELAKLTAYALENDTFADIVSTRKRVVASTEGGASRVLVNHNRLLGEYEGTIGVKTGFTKRSGRCLVSAVERDGITLIAVTLSAPSDWSDHRRLYDAGFGIYERVTLGSPDADRRLVPVVGGKSEFVTCTVGESSSAVMESGTADLRTVVECERFCYAPVERGETVGRIIWYNGETEIGRAPLIAEQSVDMVRYRAGFIERIKKYLFK